MSITPKTVGDGRLTVEALAIPWDERERSGDRPYLTARDTDKVALCCREAGQFSGAAALKAASEALASACARAPEVHSSTLDAASEMLAASSASRTDGVDEKATDGVGETATTAKMRAPTLIIPVRGQQNWN